MSLAVSACSADGSSGDLLTPRPNPVAVPYDCDMLGRRHDGAATMYEANTMYVDPIDDDADWQRAQPEDVGLDADLLNRGAEQLAEGPRILSLLVLRRDRLVLERYVHGGAARHSFNVHSASKSILATLIGIGRDEGAISSTDIEVVDLLGEKVPRDDPRRLDMSLDHLMTMTTGLDWVENATEYLVVDGSDDWVKAILSLPMAAAPGERFTYSTGASHVASALLARAVGQDTCTFANERLFEPLGIAVEHWGRDPQGVFTGGFNLYLTPRELAKFGLLILHEGRWRGRQVVSAAWVREMTRPRLVVDDLYAYGRYWWIRTLAGRQAAIAWGFGGQFVIVVPSADLVVVITADTRGGVIVPPDGPGFVERWVLPALRDA